MVLPGDPLSQREHDVKMRTLWCGSLSDQVDDRILYELFLNAGPLEKVTIPRDKETGRQKPFAFILFSHPESVKYAVILLNNTALFGHHIKLQHRETGLGVSTGSPASRVSRAGTGGHWRSLEVSLPECLPPPPLPSPVYTQPPPPPTPPASAGLQERGKDWLDRRGARPDSRLRTRASSPERRGRRERSRSRSRTRFRRDLSRSRRSSSRSRNRRDRSRSRRSRSRNRMRSSGSRRRSKSPRRRSRSYERYSYRSRSRRN